MKNHNTTIGALLPEQEPENPQASANYRRIVRSMMDRTIHWTLRLLCGLIALAGVAFCLSLLLEFFETNRGDSEMAFIAKFSMALMLLCILFYTMLAAGVAIRGKVRLGGVPAAVFGALVMAGYFIFLWSFLTFVLPQLHQQTNDPFAGNVWLIVLVCMLFVVAFFGVLAMGITFIIHLLYSHFSSQRQKLLEIELALADLSEKLPDEIR